MSKKITKEEFLKRFYTSYPESKIEILEYNGINKYGGVKCLNCGKTHFYPRIRDLLNKTKFCCGIQKSRIDKIRELIKDSEFSVVKEIDRNYIIIKHNKCGLEMKRTYNAVLDNPFYCQNCNCRNINLMLKKDELDERLELAFDGQIEILEYNGQLKSCKFRCKKCGLVFNQKWICLIESRGCPECDRNHSKGERLIAKWLEDKNIKYEAQKRFKDLNNGLSSYDFYLEINNQKYCIEVQGRQHWEEVPIFDSLSIQERRDKIKKDYALNNNIKLIEIPYDGKHKLDIDKYLLDIVSSTTISNESNI